MDALEFMRKLKRMCDSYEDCDGCGLCNKESLFLCDSMDPEKAILVVEKWSKEHIKKTNLDHVAEGLKKLGYKVDKEHLSKLCPVPCNNFFVAQFGCSHKTDCGECKKWWLEEYKEAQ